MVQTSPESNGRLGRQETCLKPPGAGWGEFATRTRKANPRITMLRITIPAGPGSETHHHPVIQCRVLIRGGSRLCANDGKTLYLKAGDPIVEVVNTIALRHNEGTIPAEIVVFYAGAVDTPITVVNRR